MQHEFADLTKNEQGILRIGISFTRCHAIMPAIITEYQRRYPHMEIQSSKMRTLDYKKTDGT